MSSKFSKILSMVAGLIGLIAFYFFGMVVSSGDEAIETDIALQSSIVSPFVSFAIFVLVATAVIALLFSLVNLFRNPDVLKRSLVSLGLMGIVLVVAYSFADGGNVYDTVGNVLDQGEAGPISKWVSTLINYTFILGVIGIGLILANMIKGFFKQ